MQQIIQLSKDKTLESTRPLRLGVTPRLRRALRVGFSALASLALCTALAAFSFLGLGPHLFGYRTETMLSGSMIPVIRPGDVVVDTAEPLSAVRVGQILTIQTPTPTHFVDSHRVIQVIRRDGQTWIRTKGDANVSPDPWVAELHGTQVWQVQAVIPYLGSAISQLRGPVLRDALLWGAPVVLVGWGLYEIWGRHGHDGPGTTDQAEG